MIYLIYNKREKMNAGVGKIERRLVMYKYTVRIEGMVCDVCAEHICEAIKESIHDANEVSCSHKSGEASFESNDDVSKEQMNVIIKNTGYKFKSISKSKVKAGKKSGFFSFLNK